MNPLIYTALNYATPSLHNLLVFAAMTAGAVIYTFAVSAIWAHWRLKRQKPAAPVSQREQLEAELPR